MCMFFSLHNKSPKVVRPWGFFFVCVRLTHQCRCSLSASCNTPSNHSQIKRPRTLPKTARQKSIILCMFSPPLGATAHYYHKHHARGGQGSGACRTCVALDGLAPSAYAGAPAIYQMPLPVTRRWGLNFIFLHYNSH